LVSKPQISVVRFISASRALAKASSGFAAGSRVADGSAVTVYDEEDIARGTTMSNAVAFAEWQGAKIKNVIGLDEVSAAGLSDEIGVRLVEVPADSGAAKAGLRVDDVILKCDGKATKSVADLLNLWKKVKDIAKLDVWRDQKSMSITYGITEHQ